MVALSGRIRLGMGVCLRGWSEKKSSLKNQFFIAEKPLFEKQYKRHVYTSQHITHQSLLSDLWQQPVRVLCNDLENYVCKYYTGGAGPAYNLFNEFLAASFLKQWQLPVPDFGIVTIAQKHMEGLGFPCHYFDIPCFGSRFMGDCKEVDKVFMGMTKNRFKNPEIAMNYVSIALFDIWLCNEDRHHDNFNLLLNPVNNNFIPIDHVNIFNGQNLDKQPYFISDNESILSSPLFPLFFYGTLQPDQKNFRSDITETFKDYIERCNENLPHILSNLPAEWRIDLSFIRDRLVFFFSDVWVSQALDFFFQLLFHNYKKLKL